MHSTQNASRMLKVQAQHLRCMSTTPDVPAQHQNACSSTPDVPAQHYTHTMHSTEMQAQHLQLLQHRAEGTGAACGFCSHSLEGGSLQQKPDEDLRAARKRSIFSIQRHFPLTSPNLSLPSARLAAAPFGLLCSVAFASPNPPPTLIPSIPACANDEISRM